LVFRLWTIWSIRWLGCWWWLFYILFAFFETSQLLGCEFYGSSPSSHMHLSFLILIYLIFIKFLYSIPEPIVLSWGKLRLLKHGGSHMLGLSIWILLVIFKFTQFLFWNLFTGVFILFLISLRLWTWQRGIQNRVLGRLINLFNEIRIKIWC